MDLFFSDAKFARKCADEKTMRRSFGNERAVKLAQRIQQFRSVDSLDEMRSLPGNLHELIGDRKGLLAISLDGPFRLLIEPDEWVEDKDGRLDWTRVKSIVIDSIIDYH